jgi:competence protein ComEA
MQQSSQHRININRADLNELTSLPGIGPGKAARIIEYRKQNGPFVSEHDIVKVKGIGEKTYKRLKDYIRVN